MAIGNTLTALTAAGVTLGCVLTAQADHCSSGSHGRDIVDTAVQAGSFNTLAAALQAAELVDVLKSDGPFTVFAPTDDAFSRLPAGTISTLLEPQNKGVLTAILTYHVVPGRLTASEVVTRTSAPTVNGQKLDISTGKGVRVDGAKVIKADISCSNGVIHVIDRVMMPSQDNIIETALQTRSFATLAAAVKAAGLAATLSGDGPFTVFAPTDEAFANLPPGTVETLLKPENRQKLADILKYHVVSGRVYATDALAAQTAQTVEGSLVRFTIQGGTLRVNDANIVTADIETSNGVIHVIDQVILPG